MEVVVPVPPAAEDFNFNNSSILGSSYMSAPSSPRPFGSPFNCYYYNSAPTSPSLASAVYRDSSYFDWEEKPESSKLVADDGDTEPFDFALGFRNQQEKQGLSNQPLATADELFEDGRIRPLKPPTLHHSFRNDTSPAREGSTTIQSLIAKEEEEMRERGRKNSSSKIRRASRSLSPLGGGGGDRDFHDFQKAHPASSPSAASFTNNSLVKSGGGGGGGSKKWRLRDLFLFRSASEGRATGRGSKDPLRRYTIHSSFSSSSPSSLSLSSFLLPFFTKRRTGREEGLNHAAKRTGKSPSVHAIQYATNRTAPEEPKKRIPLA